MSPIRTDAPPLSLLAAVDKGFAVNVEAGLTHSAIPVALSCA